MSNWEKKTYIDGISDYLQNILYIFIYEDNYLLVAIFSLKCNYVLLSEKKKSSKKLEIISSIGI